MNNSLLNQELREGGGEREKEREEKRRGEGERVDGGRLTRSNLE